MKQYLKRIAVVLVIVLISGIFGQTTYAADNNVEADTLHSLGLFQGTNNGYELDQQVTRAQAAVIMVRLLGAENEAREIILQLQLNEWIRGEAEWKWKPKKR